MPSSAPRYTSSGRLAWSQKKRLPPGSRLVPGAPTSMGIEFTTLPITAGLSGLWYTVSLASILPSIHCTIRSVSSVLPPMPRAPRAVLLPESTFPSLPTAIWWTAPVASEKKTWRCIHSFCWSSLRADPRTVNAFTVAASQASCVVYTLAVAVVVVVVVAVPMPKATKLPRHSGNSAVVWNSMFPAVTPARLCDPLAAEAGVVATMTRKASFIS